MTKPEGRPTNPDETASATPFWRFSLALYGQPEVPALLLPLQDRHGADINLVLFGLWRATQPRTLSRQDFAALDGTVADWRANVVQPARALRRTIKTQIETWQDGSAAAATLYEQAKRLELQSEHIQQDRMFAAADTVAPGTAATNVKTAAGANLGAYADFLQQTFPADIRNRLAEAAADLAHRTGK